MDFNEGYLTYEDYKGLGGTLDLMPFNLLEYEARRRIDRKTFNRLKSGENIPQEVKLCEYAMINKIETYNQTNAGNVKSESIDGYSVSFSSVAELKDIVESKNTELYDLIDTYLNGIIYYGEHLLYCGVK